MAMKREPNPEAAFIFALMISVLILIAILTVSHAKLSNDPTYYYITGIIMAPVCIGMYKSIAFLRFLEIVFPNLERKKEIKKLLSQPDLDPLKILKSDKPEAELLREISNY